MSKGYNPNQPRVPAGSSRGGQWVKREAVDRIYNTVFPIHINSAVCKEIELPDIQIGRSLGAALHPETVRLPNGKKGKLKDGSKITKVVVFAGQGTGKPVKIANALSTIYKKYGVNPKDWKKVRGDGYVVCDDGVVRHAELHWFESDKTGRVRMKAKRYFEQ